ncbi:MAG: hypothetical protein WA908_00590 [Pontixanthobacter sp.]
MSGALETQTPDKTHDEAQDGRERLVATLRRRGACSVGAGRGETAPLATELDYERANAPAGFDEQAAARDEALTASHASTLAPTQNGADEPTQDQSKSPPLSAMIDDLPDDDTRVAQHQFSRERQAKFLNRLAACGSARSAVRSTGVSHQTAYRQRRACAAFRRAWDAALLIAREQAEEMLACRAMEGVEEEVWFHGEVVGTRKRYDTRLLLAHLARLDRLSDRADVANLAEDFDAAVEALEQGRALPESPADDAGVADAGVADTPDGGAQGLSSGPCKMRSKSLPDRDRPAATSKWNMNGDGPCCDSPSWPKCDACPHYPILGKLLNRMDAARPAHAPQPGALGNPADVEACQMEAFEAGDENWWRYGADFVVFAVDAEGAWRPEGDVVPAVREDALVQ